MSGLILLMIRFIVTDCRGFRHQYWNHHHFERNLRNDVV